MAVVRTRGRAYTLFAYRIPRKRAFMTGAFTRPPVNQLVFQLFDRTVHPEFFDTLAHRRVCRDGYTLTVRMTPTGHVIEWICGNVCILEVTATATQELPYRGRLLTHPFQGERRGRCAIGGVRYEVSLQAEVLTPEVFRHVHAELQADSARPGVLFHCRPHTREGLAPLGLVCVQPLPTGLNISSFHTYPDEFAVIKTQSLIEPPPGMPPTKEPPKGNPPRNSSPKGGSSPRR